MADQNLSTEKKNNSKSYSKRPVWQWVLLYLIVGGFVYFVIYWFIFRQGNSYY